MVDVAAHLANQPSRKLCTTRQGLRARRAANTHNNDSTSSRKITQEMGTSAMSLLALAGRPIHRLMRTDESDSTRFSDLTDSIEQIPEETQIIWSTLCRVLNGAIGFRSSRVSVGVVNSQIPHLINPQLSL
jgi:hypothetical protein